MDLSDKKEGVPDAGTNTVSTKEAEWKKPGRNEHTQYDSAYTKPQETQADLQ